SGCAPTARLSAESSDIYSRSTPPSNFEIGSSHFINEPEHWRTRAKEARSLANKMNDAKSKDAMLRIAEDYERLALRAKDRAMGRLSSSRTKTLEAKGGHT